MIMRSSGDRHRKLEVLIDHQLLPLRWDSNLEPMAPSHYRHGRKYLPTSFTAGPLFANAAGEWKTNRMGKPRSPSRTELEMPEGLEEDILKARSTHTRFGQYWQTDRPSSAPTCKRFPLSEGELSRLCWNLGLPGDFDVAQITWRPRL